MFLLLGSLVSAAEPTTLTGVAADGKIAPVLLVEGRSFYVRGIATWPDGVSGLEVSATGTVTEERMAPIATVSPTGEVNQGVMPGSALDSVLSVSSWHLVGAGVGIEPGPWEIRVADGSANVHRVWRAPGETEIHWKFEPMTPERSSSGTYSGGSPGEGTLDDAAAEALWKAIRSARADTSAHVQQRQMGTTAVTVRTATGTVDFKLARSAGEALGTHLPGR